MWEKFSHWSVKAGKNNSDAVKKFEGPGIVILPQIPAIRFIPEIKKRCITAINICHFQKSQVSCKQMKCYNIYTETVFVDWCIANSCEPLRQRSEAFVGRIVSYCVVCFQ